MADGSKWCSGDVIRYEPLTRPNRWCREGIAIAEDRGWRVVLLDTFWGGGTETHVLTDEEASTGELLFNVGDYDELDRHNPGTPLTWEKYAPEDRRVITEQHGLRSRWFIRKGASEDWPTQIANAERAVEDRRACFSSARASLECAERRLQDVRQKAATAGGAR
ncbi:MAG: hypothetical protein CMK98_13710 [Pseudomonas sp.]|nr:hypothetical protein [Pseudomonas sp.]